MGSTRLNDQQMAFFDTFGFLSFPGLLADCVDKIIDEFEAVWAAHGARTQWRTARRGESFLHLPVPGSQ